MFRLTTTIRRSIPALALTTLVAGAAVAQDASADRYYDETTGTLGKTVTLEGANGGIIVTERDCTGSEKNENLTSCSMDKTFTNAAGETVTRERLMIRGPERTRAVGRYTGADGTANGTHRRWRN